MALPRVNDISITRLSIFLSLLTTVSAYGKNIRFWGNHTYFQFQIFKNFHDDNFSPILIKLFDIVNDAIRKNICGVMHNADGTGTDFRHELLKFHNGSYSDNAIFYRDRYSTESPEIEACFKTFINNTKNIISHEAETAKTMQLILLLLIPIFLLMSCVIGFYIYRKLTHKSPKYDAQVIIDFLEHHTTPYSPSALSRQRKWGSKPLNPNDCHIIRGEHFLQKTHKFPLANNIKLRVYVLGHCWVGYDELHTDMRNKIHFNVLADGLAHYFKTQSLVVSLIACCAAKGVKPNAEDSFGSKLHLALFSRLNKDSPVIARITQTCQGGRTFKLSEFEKYKDNYNALLSLPITRQTNDRNLYIYHQKNSKIMFFMQNGKQERMDAYEKTKLKIA